MTKLGFLIPTRHKLFAYWRVVLVSAPMAELVSHNIAAKSKEERDKVNVDLAASGVAYKERMNLPVIPSVVER